jgi:hypothetical protein
MQSAARRNAKHGRPERSEAKSKDRAALSLSLRIGILDSAFIYL